ncbi:MAG: hypothetical protein ACTSO4_08840, partial [Promethearchaeota archaeon]
MSFPLLLSNSMLLSFIDTYYLSFEQFSYQNSSSDITIYFDSNNYTKIQNEIKEIIPSDKLNGFILQFNSLNSTIQNQSISFKILNFSTNQFKNNIYSNCFNIIEGRSPGNNSEILVPFSYKNEFNLSLNTMVQVQFSDGYNSTFNICGFFKKKGIYRIIPENSIILVANNIEIEIINHLNSGMTFFILLNHQNMDIFNIYGFISEINNFREQIDYLLSKSITNYFILSINSVFNSNEFSNYILSVYSNLLMIIIPIIIFILLYLILFSNYYVRNEKIQLNELKYFISIRELKKKIFFSLTIDSIILYLITIPLSMGIYFLAKGFIFSNFYYYFPPSFFFFTIIFLFLNLFTSYFYIISNWQKSREVENNQINQKKVNKRYKRIVLIGMVVLFPFITKILQYSYLITFNPIQIIFITIFSGINSIISLIFPFILIFLIVSIATPLFIRITRFFSKLGFKKYKDNKFNLMSKFINFKSIIIIIFISLQIGFMNYYAFLQTNSYLQEENELAIKLGSDIKLSTPFSHDSTVNISKFLGDDDYCKIEILPVYIDNQNILFEKNCILLNLNASSYYSVLNMRAKLKMDINLIREIENLNNYEILVPRYFQLRYQLKKGNIFRIMPQNGSDYTNSEPFESNAKNLVIAGFFDFLPGLNHKPTLYPTAYMNNLIILTNLNFNHSLEFAGLPTSKTYLVNDQGNKIDIIHNIIQEGGNIRYESLENELEILQSKYSTISKESSLTIIYISIIIFIMMSMLLIYNYLAESDDYWTIFQLLNVNKRFIKKFIFWTFIGILALSFLTSLFGIMSGLIIFILDNIYLKDSFYFYPIFIYLDVNIIFFNLIYFTVMFLIIWFLVKKLWNFNLDYDKIKKYNPG